MKSLDIIQLLADKLGIERKDAKIIAWPYLYGSTSGLSQLIIDYDLVV